MIEDRHLHVTYCDDIRREINGKYSLIGCYGSELFVGQAPVVLPKLCMRIEAVTKADRPFKKLQLRVYHDDDLVADADLTKQAEEMLASADIEPGKYWQTVLMMVELSPFTMNGEGSLRVEAETETETLRAGRLDLRVRDKESAVLPTHSRSDRQLGDAPIAKTKKPAPKHTRRKSSPEN